MKLANCDGLMVSEKKLKTLKNGIRPINTKEVQSSYSLEFIYSQLIHEYMKQS